MRFVYLSLLLIDSVLNFGQVPETNLTFNFGNHWIFGNKVYLNFSSKNLINRNINDVNWLEGTSSIEIEEKVYYISRTGSNIYINKLQSTPITPPIGGSETSTQGFVYLSHIEQNKIYLVGSNSGGVSYWYEIQNDTFTTYLSRFPFHGGEKQQAVNHQNGRDIWYANHAQTGDSIYFFLIKKEGMVDCPVVTHTGNSYETWAATQGQMKFSSDGNFLVEASFIEPYALAGYLFNREYPKLDTLFKILNNDNFQLAPRFFHGVEFSPDSKKLYFSQGRKFAGLPPVTLNQLDISSLNSDSIISSWINLDTLFNLSHGSLQLAPNGKIYVAMPNQKYLGVINDPNELGTACNYERQGLTLDSGGTCLYGLPTFNQSYFYTPQIDFRYEENCLTNEYQFWGADTFGALNFEWRITDTRQLTQDTRQGKNIVFTFSADILENKYDVTFIASNGTKTDSVTKTLTIRPKMQTDFLGRDTFYCAGSSFGLTLNTPENLHCIHWGVNGEVLEPYSNLMGDTVVGYENFYGYIPENTYRIIDTAGIYTARITNKSFCQVTDTIVVAEKPRPSKGVVSRLGNLLSCDVVASQYRWYYNGKLIRRGEQTQVPDSNGYWQVQLVSEFGCESELSDSFYVGFASIKSLDINHLTFSIYPNPSDGHISIAVPKKGLYKIQIIDFNGKVIYNTKQNLSLPFELEFAFARGSYTLQLTDEDGNVGVKKVVVE